MLTVQVVYTHLLQFVHFRYCWSHCLMAPTELPVPEGAEISWVYGEFCWFALSCCQSLLCKSMQSSLFLRRAAKRRDIGGYGFCFVFLQALKNTWKSEILTQHRCKRAAVVFPLCLTQLGILTLSFFDIALCLAVFGWMTPQFQRLPHWKKLHSIHLQSARCFEQLHVH